MVLLLILSQSRFTGSLLIFCWYASWTFACILCRPPSVEFKDDLLCLRTPLQTAAAAKNNNEQLKQESPSFSLALSHLEDGIPASQFSVARKAFRKSKCTPHPHASSDSASTEDLKGTVMGQSGSASQKTVFFAFKSSICRHPVEILSSRRSLTRCPPRKCNTDLCALDISNCQSSLQSRFQQYNAKSHFLASLAQVPRDRSLISLSASDTKDFHVVEKEALLLFKGSISKDPRGILSSWTFSDSSSSPCTGGWRGIGCDSTGRIVSLDLHACNLTGQINPSLSNLTFLSRLNLSINSFSGPIPPQLGRLSFLSSLDFKWNALIGNIPPELGNCTSLVWLDLSHNQLNGTLPPSLGQLSYLYMLQLHDLPSLTGPIPHQLGNLTNLTYLYLGSNSLTGSIPPELGNLYKLKELYLMLNHLNGTIPAELGRLQNLEYLSLFMNTFEGSIPPQLGNLTNLRYLWVLLSNLNGTIPRELGNLHNLIELDLSLNFAISGTIPSDLGRLGNLEVLKLFQMNLTGSIPIEFGNLSSLQHFYAFSNHLSGGIPRQFGELKNLINLHLYSNSLSGPLPIELSRLHNLQSLILFGNTLSGSIPLELGDMKSLTSLYLGGSFFTGGLPETVGNLTDLQYFEVSPNLLSGPVPKSLGKLKRLIYIDISKNKFSGSLPTEISNCTALQWLKASNNSLNGAITISFNSLSALHTLALANNQFIGHLPDGFANKSSLVVLDLQRNQLSGELPVSWSELENLRVLSVAYNSLEGILPDWIWSLSKLQLINLGNNNFSGNISSRISNADGLKYNNTVVGQQDNLYSDDIMADIKGSDTYYKYLWAVVISLDLSGNMLSGTIPDEIGALLGIFNLNLSHNAFIGPIPASLSNVLTLESLDLSDNRLSGSIPSQLTQLTSLSFLNLSDNQLSGPIPTGDQFDSFSNGSYLGNKGLCGHPLSVKCSENIEQFSHNHHKREPKVTVLVGSISGIVVIIALAALAYYFVSRRRKPDSLGSVKIFDKRVKISYKNLLDATNNFRDANILGSGGSCTVYRGLLEGKMVVAVKRMNNSHPERQDIFNAEFSILGQIRHRNLVRMLGIFISEQLKCLVLEYIPNGDLDRHLYTDDHRLSWERRFHIAIGVACGLSYLHDETGIGQILHCDLKPSNILLDADFEPHISDFGIARLVNAGRDGVSAADVFQGSFGYVAPEYAYGGKLTAKGDVYSYGIVLLEMLTRKRPTDDAFTGTSMTLWVQSTFRMNWIDVIDPILHENLADEKVGDEIYNVLVLAMYCVRRAPEDRPLMKDVLEILLHVKEQKPPKRSLDELLISVTPDKYHTFLLQNSSSSGVLSSNEGECKPLRSH